MLITFIAVSLLLYLFFVVVIYQQNVKAKCFSCKFVLKLIIIFLVLLTFITFLITCFFFVFTIVNSSVCKISQQMLTMDNFSSFFSAEDQLFAQVLNTCVGAKATGNIAGDLVKDYDYQNLLQIL